MSRQKGFVRKIKQSGILEFLYLGLSIIISGIVSRCKIFFLRLRKYNIDYSVDLKPHVVLFQSQKNSIKVGRQTRIGFGTRLKAGFEGKIFIGKGVWLDDYSFIHAQKEIRIGDGCMIATSVYIVDFDHKIPAKLFDFRNVKKETYVRSPVVIGKNVWIGTHSVILRGVTIGDNVVIGAGSVVTKSIPANTVAVGVPARVIRKI
jgi:acetyltransferase-like isoleucine patch superfamily enzyme